MLFRKRQAKQANAADGKSFLAKAREDHAAIFADIIEREEEFEQLSDFIDHLEAAAWQLCEAMAKQSYKNGIARGRSSRQER